MAASTKSYVDAIDSQMNLIGWRYFPRYAGGKWRKLYPPPHEVEGSTGKMKFIAEYGGPVWKTDLRRAQVLVAQMGGPSREGLDKPT